MRTQLRGVSANIEDRRFDDPKELELRRVFEGQKETGRRERSQQRGERQDPTESVAARRIREEVGPFSKGLTTKMASRAKGALRRYRRRKH
jgi:hypothetical protein